MTYQQIEILADKLLIELPIGKDFLFVSYFASYVSKNEIKVDPNGFKDNVLEQLTDFMIENQYLNFDENSLDDSLTQKGVDAKKAGGHFKYLESLKNKEKSIVNDFSGATIGQVNQSSNFSDNSQISNITASKEKEANKNLLIKFWELISENKLISSILLIIILYLVKVVFGINLKN